MATRAANKALRIALDEIIDLENELDGRIEKFLRSAGWTATSETPDCCWMWERRIGDKVYRMTRSGALEMERRSVP